MHHRNKYYLCTALILICGLLIAQEAPTFSTSTQLVVLHASVMDKSGKLVTNIGKDSFKVFENGVEQQIQRFLREDVPLSLALVIDNSGSMRDKRQKVEAAALAMLKASNRNDEIMIVNFNDEAFEDVSFTNDMKKMEEGLTRIDSRGGTAMRDAVSMTVDTVKEKGKKTKKVVLVVTDGNDNTSLMTLEKLLEKAHRAEVLIYSIGLLNEEERREAVKAKRALNALANASGGLAYFPKDLAEVERIALDVAHELRNQYMLAYSPTNAALDGTFRQVKVTVNAPGKPVVRTRAGYYAGSPKTSSRVSSPQSLRP